MTTAETYAAGYANAAKLDGAAALGPAFMKVVLNKRYINDSCASTVDVSSEVDFDYRGKRQLPPTKATFLSYGFMPTTATMTLEQVGPPAAIHTHTVTNTPTYPEETTVTAQLVMRLSDVEVNGVPLDVGPDCRTERPFEQVLKGYGQSYPPAGYLVAYGGTLNGYAHIPPFEGCGATEDLDPIFTSAISSPGKKADNYTKMTQAPLCVATNPEGRTARRGSRSPSGERVRLSGRRQLKGDRALPVPRPEGLIFCSPGPAPGRPSASDSSSSDRFGHRITHPQTITGAS